MKTWNIIEYLKPTYHIIENPQTGLLKNQAFMNNIPFIDIGYWKYGMLYRKWTRLSNNVSQWVPKPLCKKDSDSMNGNRHKCEAQHSVSNISWGNHNFQTEQLYIIPESLICEIFNSMTI